MKHKKRKIIGNLEEHFGNIYREREEVLENPYLSPLVVSHGGGGEVGLTRARP
jgi:hypothetical protein